MGSPQLELSYVHVWQAQKVDAINFDRTTKTEQSRALWLHIPWDLSHEDSHFAFSPETGGKNNSAKSWCTHTTLHFSKKPKITLKELQGKWWQTKSSQWRITHSCTSFISIQFLILATSSPQFRSWRRKKHVRALRAWSPDKNPVAMVVSNRTIRRIS